MRHISTTWQIGSNTSQCYQIISSALSPLVHFTDYDISLVVENGPSNRMTRIISIRTPVTDHAFILMQLKLTGHLS